MFSKIIRTKTALVLIIAGLLFGGSFGAREISHYKEVKGLKNEIQLLQTERNDLLMEKALVESAVVNTIIDNITEDKEKGVKLIVFESNTTGYSKTIREEGFNGIEKTLNTAFKYSVALDMTGVRVDRTQDDKVYVDVHASMVDVFSIEKGNYKIDTETNFLNTLKGNTRDAMNQDLIDLADKEITREISNDFNNRRDMILSTLKQKIAENYQVDVKDIEVNVRGVL